MKGSMDPASGSVFLLMNANEMNIARGQNSLTHSLTQWLVNAGLMVFTHGVYTVFLINAAGDIQYTPTPI